MIPIITLHNLVICSLCFLCAGWMIVKVLSEPTPAADDDEDFGGIPGEFVFPVFDPPGGCQLDELLVDRMPVRAPETALSGTELSARSVRITDRPARRHPVLAAPTQMPAGWCAAQAVVTAG